MSEPEGKSYKILDWIILSFFVIFILSLSNSIFINQVGYFGALLFILIKTFLTRKNHFTKTGLELARAKTGLVFYDYRLKRATQIPQELKDKLNSAECISG